jgi:hypothetical protein
VTNWLHKDGRPSQTPPSRSPSDLRRTKSPRPPVRPLVANWSTGQGVGRPRPFACSNTSQFPRTVPTPSLPGPPPPIPDDLGPPTGLTYRATVPPSPDFPRPSDQLVSTAGAPSPSPVPSPANWSKQPDRPVRPPPARQLVSLTDPPRSVPRSPDPSPQKTNFIPPPRPSPPPCQLV